MAGHDQGQTQPVSSLFASAVVTDANEDGSPAITFEPWTNGPAVGFKVTRHADGQESYIYLNPSTDTMSDGEFSPDAFVYTGTAGNPALDSPAVFVNVKFEGDA
jgi:hypothetical protein